MVMKSLMGNNLQISKKSKKLDAA